MSDTPKYFKLIKEYFLNHFIIYSDKYPPIIKTKVLTIHPHGHGKMSKNFVLEITIENSKKEREIFFSYREGPNSKKTISNHIVLEVKNTSKNHSQYRKNFFISDFCELYNLKLSEPSFFETTGKNYSFEKFKKYMDSVKFIIENSDLHRILNGEIWIDVPINMKPYK